VDGRRPGHRIARGGEAHASNCERCQALLATMAKTVPVEVQGGRVPGAKGLPWFKWLAPIAATAAVKL
jgi:hypothetical protein